MAVLVLEILDFVLLLIEIIQKIEVDALTGVPQNEDDATYSIWRNIEDCHIDWNKSAKEIYDFVRAVGSPYPGAFTFLNGEKIYIKRTEIAEDLSSEIVERYGGLQITSRRLFAAREY